MAEIETDKATMDYESFNTGTVLYLGAKEGEAVKINDVLAVVGNKGEDYAALLAGAQSAAATGGKVEQPKTETQVPALAAIDTSGIKAKIVQMPKMSDTMAEGVIAAQSKEIADMQGWRATWFADLPNTGGMKSDMGEMAMGDMQISSDESTPFDQRFLTAMISHHQGAIDMAKVELEHGMMDFAVVHVHIVSQC